MSTPIEATRFLHLGHQNIRELIIKGFVLDDERSKQGKEFGKDYFGMLERVGKSGQRTQVLQKITDMYAQKCSSTMIQHAEITSNFYKTVQNNLHWAITGHTAAELIAERANARTAWTWA